MNMARVLQERATHSPDTAAILDVYRGQTRRLTFAELEQAAERMATLLRRSGLHRGDTVLVFHPISAELYTALAAMLRLGLVAMFVDPAIGLQGLARCCQLRPPQAFLGNSATYLLSLWKRTLRRIPVKFSTGIPIPGAIPLQQSAHLTCDTTLVDCAGDAPALVSLTSGSTGQPKATIRTHGFLRAQHSVLEQSVQPRPGEVELATLPMFVLANLASGMTSLLPNADLRRPDAINAGPVVAQLQQHCPERASAAPAFLERIADHCEGHQVKLSSVRRWFTGGGPVSPVLIDRLVRIAPNSEVTVVFGSSEAEPMATISSGQIGARDRQAMREGRGLLVGCPVSAIQMRILKDQPDQRGASLARLTDSHFEHLCLPAGEPGEIVVRGEHVLSGYLDNSAVGEHRLLVDGVAWHRTGDAGFLDDRGRLWLLGRCGARLADGRGTVYPLGVEQAAAVHPSIRRAAFLMLNEKRLLAVQLRRAASRPDLEDLRRALAFAHVDVIQVMRQIPVDTRHNSKIDYRALRQTLRQSIDNT